MEKKELWEELSFEINNIPKIKESFEDDDEKAILGSGNKSANLLFIGDESDLYETEDLKVMVGSSGEFLIKLCDMAGFTADEMDLITDIDWTKTKKLYLPIHFKGKSFYIKGGLNFKALMVANYGEGVISPAVDYAKDNPLNLPFYNLDLRSYGVETKIDYDKIVLDVICYYIIEEYHTMDFKLRKELIKKYRKFIISSYSSMKDYCTSEEILEFMVKHIKLKEKNIDKQAQIW